MALFKILKGQEKNLPANKTEGWAYVTTDEGNMYVDVSASKRVRIGAHADKADVATKAEGDTESIRAKYLAKLKQVTSNGTTFTFRGETGDGSDANDLITIPNASTSVAGLITNAAQTIAGTKTLQGNIVIKPGILSNYQEGLRICNADNGWATLILGGTATSGTSASSWSLHTNGGNFYLTHNGDSSSSTGILQSDANGNWQIKNRLGVNGQNIGYQLYVNGESCFDGKVTVNAKVHITNTEEVNVGTNGAFIIGSTTGKNLAIDNNEIMVRNNSEASTLYLNSGGGLVRVGFGGIQSRGHIVPSETNLKNLGHSSLRWAKLYIGTADTYGSVTKPIYWDAGVPTACTYELKSTVEGGAANRLPYYNAANNIGPTSHYANMTQVGINETNISAIGDYNFYVNGTSYFTGYSKFKKRIYIIGDESTDKSTRLEFTASDESTRAYIAWNGDKDNTRDSTTNLRIKTEYGDIKLRPGSGYVNINDSLIIEGSSSSTLRFATNDNSTVNTFIRAYADIGKVDSQTYVVKSGGTFYLGSGKSAYTLYDDLGETKTENMFFTSDEDMFFYTNCDSSTDRFGIKLDRKGQWYPLVPNTGSFGLADYRWNHLYARHLDLSASDTGKAPIIIRGGSNSYREGIRIFGSGSATGWTTITMGGDQESGTDENTWSIHTYNQGFYITHNGSDAESATGYLHSTAAGIWKIGPKLRVATNTSDYALNAASFICDDWVRTKGVTGWYNETYGGGWYMSDSTYIRNYNSKTVRMDNVCLGADNNSYRLYVNGTSYFNGNVTYAGHILPSAHNTYDLGSTSARWRYGYLGGLFITTDTGFTSSAANQGKAGSYLGAGFIEMTASTPFIDFHNANSTADYSARIISDGANRLHIQQGGTPVALTYNSRTINPLLYNQGALYASSQIESAEYFLNNRATAGGGFYLYGNNVQYGRLFMQTVGTTSAVGITQLELGNNKASGVANNSRGKLYMYGQTASIKLLLDATDRLFMYLYCVDGNNYYTNTTGATATDYWQIYPEGQHLRFRTHTTGSYDATAGTGAAGGWKYIQMFENGGLALNSTSQSVTPFGGSATTFILRAEGSGYFNGDVWGTASFIANAGSSTTGRGFIARNQNVQYARMYIGTVGTVGTGSANGTVGVGWLMLGNGTAVSTAANAGANNARGAIRLYGTNANYTNIYSQTNGNRDFYLPNYAGTMYAVHVGGNGAVGNATTPVYIAANGRVTTCTEYKAALDGRYVLKSGDTMTGNLIINNTNIKDNQSLLTLNVSYGSESGLTNGLKINHKSDGNGIYVDSSEADGASISVHTASGRNITGLNINHEADDGYGIMLTNNNTCEMAGIYINNIADNADGIYILQNKADNIALDISGKSSAVSTAFRTLSSGSITSWIKTDGYAHFEKIYGAVWNDYAEYRKSDENEPGRVVLENKFGVCQITTKRLQSFAGVISDTFGFSQGETSEAKIPVAVAGRVLVYPYQNKYNYQIGDCVCAAPGGTVDIMTREEIIMYPDRIVGTVSEIPDYEEWGETNIKVNGRIWIKVK